MKPLPPQEYAVRRWKRDGSTNKLLLGQAVDNLRWFYPDLSLGEIKAQLDAGRTLALANKESLIMGGPLVLERAKPGQIVPVDSEHSALAQCLRSGTPCS